MDMERYGLNRQLAQMLKGGVIMDVTTPEQAEIAEKAGACAVMALERIPADIRAAGYNASTNAELLESAKKQLAMIQAVLGGIGAVSLLVAAIGIANTMMMSIYERTKEIGVMKVLGCDIRNIQALFLMEAGFIGFIGGIVGSGFSALLSIAINKLATSGDAVSNMGFSGNICRIPLWLVPAAIAFAVLIGMIAGFIPSLRAMRLSPLAAIRND